MTDRPGDDRHERLRAVVRPMREVPGWGTVDLDRTIADLPGRRVLNVTDDAHLGAYSRLVVELEPPEASPLPGPAREAMAGATVAVLLEPSTEGPLAATLARHGEGIVARYLVVSADGVDAARAAGFALSSTEAGPLGRQRLVFGGSRFGPHLLLVDAESQRDGGRADGDAADTIEP